MHIIDRYCFLALACILFSVHTRAQYPKREFRAAWIATVSNIDWPSKPGLPSYQQQHEFIARLDKLKELGCNAVIVQVRPACDAFYESKEEPWSRYLTGKQGQPPFPYYDPLTFMIEEAHKRNMEFHAWFNPFRALTDSKKNPNPPEHVTRRHPDWLINYGGKGQLDPGLPEAREYVLRIIMDVVKRYDIDAVHLDDYFYPYRIAGVEFGDARSYAKYGKGKPRDEWRRDNVSLFISLLNTNIKREKYWVKFGVSPFGVWRNASKDPEGSPTRGGQTNYDDLYADVLLWQRNGWIDYLLPQLYWEHEHRLVAFEILMPWWDEHAYARHMYYGLGVYRMLNATKGPWAGTKELLWQMRDIRTRTKNPGYAFYSSSNFDKLSSAISDSIAKLNAFPALPPQMKWIDSTPPPAPVVKANPSPKGTVLRWEASSSKDPAIRFVVYRFAVGEAINLERADRIVTIASGKEYIDPDAAKFKQAKYVVTALDRLWNESAPSNTVTTKYE
ncbi:MAG: glycoside hydrolase family 10 protein [Sphingobacteriales bacterium]|nr:MAG: glycoside hydrolase family 10 protein [Sphingobacteriales bacterium]